MVLYERIPKERIAILVGKGGETKHQIERRGGVRIELDSETGEVTIDESKAENPVMGLKVKDLVKAIGRGFSPEHALMLLKEDFYFHLFDINDYVGKNVKHVIRMRARVIGTHGKTRAIIEEMTGAYLSIYGDTVAIIGDLEGLETAKVAVDMLLSGSEHSTVYRYMEDERRRLKTARMGFEYVVGR